METDTVCLLFMCYCRDRGCMPARRPGVLNPVFTSQIRHNVHKLCRVLRWSHSPSNLLELPSRCAKHSDSPTQRLLLNPAFVERKGRLHTHIHTHSIVMQSEVAYRWYVCVRRGDEFHKASCPQHAGAAFQVAAGSVYDG